MKTAYLKVGMGNLVLGVVILTPEQFEDYKLEHNHYRYIPVESCKIDDIDDSTYISLLRHMFVVK